MYNVRHRHIVFTIPEEIREIFRKDRELLKTLMDEAAKYIGRYVSRPAISESRILKYEEGKVTYCYERHEDNEYVEETIIAKEFIGKMLIHVPDRQFKMVRYYGVYSGRTKRKTGK